jgi:hypothetical protein
MTGEVATIADCLTYGVWIGCNECHREAPVDLLALAGAHGESARMGPILAKMYCRACSETWGRRIRPVMRLGHGDQDERFRK